MSTIWRKWLHPFDRSPAQAKDLPAQIHTQVMSNPCLAGKLHAYQSDQSFYILPKVEHETVLRDEGGLPIPPERFWWGYDPLEFFLESGKTDIYRMLGEVQASGWALTPGSRILDFGCGPGRMIRGLHDRAETCEIWGVDIFAEPILWCQQHLSPPFRFVTTTSLPHLTFPYASFDLIYAASVFTHIDDRLTPGWWS
jgi:2-polyprenyl-3-methyl-5-hydroxy-6-metoxy-1,4-benzoquinol methylase